MTWGDIAELLGREHRRLEPSSAEMRSLFPNPERAPVAFLELERSTNDSVEAAVRQFSLGRGWPTLTMAERAMVCFRLAFAGPLADLLEVQPARRTGAPEPEAAASPEEDEERLGWLMLYAWEQVGFRGLHESLKRLLGDRGGEDGGGAADKEASPRSGVTGQ